MPEFPTRLIDRESLRSLLASVRPMTTDKPLIRLGAAGDGGYLVPDDLEGISACFSPGVANVSAFEKDCAERGMEVFMADRQVTQPATSHPRFHFMEKYIGVTDSTFFMPMDKWVGQSIGGGTSDLLLQMDIEGYEYENLLNLSDALMQRFRIILVEFHSLQMLYSRPFFQIASRALVRLAQTHTCVHLHPNNCATAVHRMGFSIPRVMEFTFLRNDRIHYSRPTESFPHALDADNTPNPTLVLPDCWYTA